jgi:DNA-directed RNA polymerase omega subunit
MAYQPLERLLPRSGGSVYKLVLMAAKRAIELADGMPKLIDFPSSNKTTTVALDEVLGGKVELKEVASTRQTKEAAPKEAKDKKKE